MKRRPVGDELFHADGWTGVTKVVVAFRNFANATENVFMSRGITSDTKIQFVHHNEQDPSPSQISVDECHLEKGPFLLNRSNNAQCEKGADHINLETPNVNYS